MAKQVGCDLAGSILTPSGWLDGELTFDEHGSIAKLVGKPIPRPPASERRILAGFVDLHVHGGGGGDAMAGEEQVRAMARFHAQSGTVALAPTTMCAEVAAIEEGLAGIDKVRRGHRDDEAMVIGAHLEGPFISARRLGAQPDHVLPYDEKLLERWLRLCRLAVATLAPEIDGGDELIVRLARQGCKVQIGHSDATAAQARAALRAGANGFTHLFNAMSGFSHRDGGVATCALAHANHAELICDGLHVEDAAALAAIRAIPLIYAITDATAAAGMEDGEHALGGATVIKEGSSVRTPAGELAGTAMTLWDARCHLIRLGLSEEAAQEMVAARPAVYAQLPRLGYIREGSLASLVVASGEAIDEVWLEGERLG